MFRSDFGQWFLDPFDCLFTVVILVSSQGMKTPHEEA